MGRASKAQTVKLREKPLKNDGASLYLEWNSGGKTEKKYLNIHLAKEERWTFNDVTNVILHK